MAKKLKLVSTSDSDYQLIGIASHLKDYRLIWSLNTSLSLKLTKLDDLPAFNDKLNTMLQYPLYFFEQAESFKTWYFLGNQNEKSALIPEQKQTHFFILIKGSFSDESLQEIVQTIKKIKNVLAVHLIAATSVKNIEFILNDLELHMMEIAKKSNK